MLSPLLTVLHGGVDWVATAPDDVTASSSPQEGVHGLYPPEATRNMEGRLPRPIQLIHPRTHPTAQRLEEGETKSRHFNRDLAFIDILIAMYTFLMKAICICF